MKPLLRKAWRFLRWPVFILTGLLIALLLFIELFDRYLATERGARWLYSDVAQFADVQIKFTPGGVRYLEIGQADKPPLMLIHGAPGSLFDWKYFAKDARLYQHYRLLIPERPGYGATRPRGAVTSVETQALRLLDVLDGEAQPAVVMGHSYGAPIALVMDALAPYRIAKVIGVSGQYDPDDEIIFPISYVICFPLFKYLLPRFIWVSNEEKLDHPAALREIEPLYRRVSDPVVLVHGDADSLVPYENSPFLMKYLNGRVELITLPGRDHPLQMQEVTYLVDLALTEAASGDPAGSPAKTDLKGR